MKAAAGKGVSMFSVSIVGSLLVLSLTCSDTDAKSVLIAGRSETTVDSKTDAKTRANPDAKSTSAKATSATTSAKRTQAVPSRKTPAGVMTEAKAVALVSARADVKKFLREIKNSKIKGSSAQVEFDRKEGNDFVVHVYEYVPDDAESGHTATFNWYHVNAKTGKVSTEF